MPVSIIRSRRSWIWLVVPAILLPAAALQGGEKDPVADVAPVKLFVVAQEGLPPAASRDHAQAKALSQEYGAQLDELQEQRDALYRELKKSHGKFRNWPPAATARLDEADLGIAALIHEYHPRLNPEELVAATADWVARYVEGGDFPGFLGKVRSPLVRVDTAEQAHLVIEVQGRYGPKTGGGGDSSLLDLITRSGLPMSGLPEYPFQGVCFRVTAGGLWGASELESLSWPHRIERKGVHPVYLFHRATADEPYWEMHVTARMDPPYGRMSGVGVVMVFDELVQTNPTLFGGSAP